MMILDKFFLKYEGMGGRLKLTSLPPEKTTLKKPSLIKVKVIFTLLHCGKLMEMSKRDQVYIEVIY